MSEQARRNDPTRCPKHGKGRINGIPDDPRTTGNRRTAARTGDWARCPGGSIDVIVEGAATVEIGGRPAARVGLKLWHGGVIQAGSPNIEIGGPTLTAAEIIAAAKDRARRTLKCAKKRLDRWNDEDKAMFKKWFGSDSEAARQQMSDRVARSDGVIDGGNYRFGSEDRTDPGDVPDESDTFAHVDPTDTAAHNIYLDPKFWRAPPEGADSQGGTLAHEVSHFNDVGGTDDHVYGSANAARLAQKDPAKAMNNADNYEYFMEDVQKTCP
jgi:uncharacterized Zn-binding protein involved in type VI secretion